MPVRQYEYTFKCKPHRSPLNKRRPGIFVVILKNTKKKTEIHHRQAALGVKPHAPTLKKKNEAPDTEGVAVRQYEYTDVYAPPCAEGARQQG